MRGWNPSTETADLLHALWLGVGRDAIGSLLMDFAEHMGQHMETWNERLALVLADFQGWCVSRGARPSTIDELSCSEQMWQVVWVHVVILSHSCHP